MSAIMTKPLLVILIIPFSIVLAACNRTPFLDGKRMCEDAVNSFHDLYNRERFYDIYDKADEDYKRWVGGDLESLRRFRSQYHRYGRQNESFLRDMRVDYNARKAIACLTYDTGFARGRATEIFYFDVTGQNAILHCYTIDHQWDPY